VGFETTTPVLEWAKTFHAFDRPATVIGVIRFLQTKLPTNFFFFSSGSTCQVNIGIINIHDGIKPFEDIMMQ
jgi:hypothetical protein